MFASRISALLASLLAVSSAPMRNTDTAHVYFTFSALADCRSASLTNFATPNKIFIQYNQALTDISIAPTDPCKLTTASNGAVVYVRKFEVASSQVFGESLKALLTNSGLARPNVAHVAEIYASATCSNAFPANTTVTYFPTKGSLRMPLCDNGKNSYDVALL